MTQQEVLSAMDKIKTSWHKRFWIPRVRDAKAVGVESFEDLQRKIEGPFVLEHSDAEPESTVRLICAIAAFWYREGDAGRKIAILQPSEPKTAIVLAFCREHDAFFEE